MLRKINQQRMKGFTLIELLIVMAVLGVLAVVVLIAINPAEQLARARDAGKVSGVQQLGRAATAYYVAHENYPPENGTWINTLVTSEDLASAPADPATGHNSTCANGTEQFDWCYDYDVANQQIAVSMELEADQYVSQCGTNAWSVFSSVDARGGWGCTEPVANTSYSANFK